MNCHICNDNKATVHVTEFMNGKVVELHMCDRCAKEKDMKSHLPVGLNELLTGLMQFTSKADDIKKYQDTCCPGCKLSIDEIQETGRVGCEQCYQTFSSFLMPLIRKVQGGVRHTGKVPQALEKKYSVSEKVKKLEKQMQKLIDQEEYEKAAKVRDQLTKLKK